VSGFPWARIMPIGRRLRKKTFSDIGSSTPWDPFFFKCPISNQVVCGV
jgi:hypothetical protein